MSASSNKNMKLHWTSPQCDCNDPALANCNFLFYNSFILNNKEYKVGDFVIVLKATVPGQFPRARIAKLLCLYESLKDIHSNAPYRGTVRWYTKAEDIPHHLNKTNFKLDKDIEVIEDMRSLDIFISLEHIKKKCDIIFPSIDEKLELNSVLQKNKSSHFICRYKINTNYLIPICASEDTHVLREINCHIKQFSSPNTKTVPPLKLKLNANKSPDFDSEILNVRNYSAKKVFTSDHSNYKRSASMETLTDEEECQENVSKVRSPRSPAKMLRLTPSKRTISDSNKMSAKTFPPIQKDGVKRNLNSSFGETPEKSLLNYSIVDDHVDSDTPLKIRLKVSNKNISPTVLLKRLSISDKNINKILSNKDKVLLCGATKTPTNIEKKSARVSFCDVDDKNHLRHSSRSIQRVSYAEYISPKGETNSPSKRTPRKTLFDNKLDKLSSQRTRNNSKCTEDDDLMTCTPRRSSRRKSVEVQEEPIRTPRRSAKKKALQIIHETLVHDSPDEKSSKRTIRTPSKYDDYDIHISPRKAIAKEDKNSSPKRIRTPAKYSDSNVQETPSKRTIATPKKTPTTKKYTTPVKTPRTHRVSSISTPKSILKHTPNSRARLIREGVIQPSVQSRETFISKNNTPLAQARSQLHVSYVPKSLPCREKEFKDIFSFLEAKLEDKCGGCMYVSGVPGTGKTATVTEVIRSLEDGAAKKKIPRFTYVNINGMRLSEPRQAYVEILKQLDGKSLAWEQAQSILENKFTKSTKKTIVPTILVVDELDILCTKRQDVVYNLLDWPTKSNAQLIVVTIANTMDLPERLLMSRVTSRLGLTRLTFQAYTHKQLQEIVMKRLSGTNAFNPDAVQLVARKVASVSGDARRALDICRRAAEIAELEGKDTLVSMNHINDALNAMITQPKVQAIKHCSQLEKLFLKAVVAEVERTGVEETCFLSVFNMLPSIAALEGFKMVSITVALCACSRLGSCRLLLVDKTDIYQKIILNVSSDDVYYALKDD